MYPTYVMHPGGTKRPVHNLGWILRNWRTVESLEWVFATSRRDYDGFFLAHMRDGRVYVTRYASFDVWKGFINRPVFQGVPVTVNGIAGRV